MSFADVEKLASLGLKIIRLVPGTKIPFDEGFPELATSELERLRTLWFDPVLGFEQPFNIGISTTGYVGIDIDNKNGKDGDGEIIKLELEGCIFPPTYEQTTPTGGRHLLYRTRVALSGSVSALAPGVDVRGTGNQLVGAGSEIGGKLYTGNGAAVADAPEWMYSRIKPKEKKPLELKSEVEVDESRAAARAIHYLEHEAPISVKGQGGDQTAYCVAARLKDLGVSQRVALELMLDHWNERCPPGWKPERLAEKISHAWRYGLKQVGVAAPEMDFVPLQADPISPCKSESPPDRHPFQKLNEECAFVIAGGGHRILWERKNAHGRDEIVHLSEEAFHKKYAAYTMLIDDKPVPVTRLWMKNGVRRSYDGFCFRPGLETPDRYYNLFRGFAYAPSTEGSEEAKKAVEDFLSHIEGNVCLGDEALSRWILGYFAHVFQRPWEKPGVALVFRGGKGVGKSFVFDTVSELLGSHAMVTSEQKHLTGNFNSYLERLLFITLEEAFWGGNKTAEGALKHLITGRTNVIERKGEESYTVESCTRVGIIGNEEWLVPATQDERRFAVFDVGDGQKQNRRFFQSIREGMEAGGYGILLRYFLNYDLSSVAVGEAPNTKGLADQKQQSLSLIQQWWLDCLSEGAILGKTWETRLPKDSVRDAYARHLRGRHIDAKIPSAVSFGVQVGKLGVTGDKKVREGTEWVNCYSFPSLEEARKSWDKMIGRPVEWPKDEL